jgi:hypothetical protein
MTLTPEKIAKLKQIYKDNAHNPKSVIMFEGNELLVGYLKYLIQWLESKEAS